MIHGAAVVVVSANRFSSDETGFDEMDFTTGASKVN